MKSILALIICIALTSCGATKESTPFEPIKAESEEVKAQKKKLQEIAEEFSSYYTEEENKLMYSTVVELTDIYSNPLQLKTSCHAYIRNEETLTDLIKLFTIEDSFKTREAITNSFNYYKAHVDVQSERCENTKSRYSKSFADLISFDTDMKTAHSTILDIDNNQNSEQIETTINSIKFQEISDIVKLYFLSSKTFTSNTQESLEKLKISLNKLRTYEELFKTISSKEQDTFNKQCLGPQNSLKEWKCMLTHYTLAKKYIDLYIAESNEVKRLKND